MSPPNPPSPDGEKAGSKPELAPPKPPEASVSAGTPASAAAPAVPGAPAVPQVVRVPKVVSTPASAGTPKKPVFVLPTTKRRDLILTIVAVVVIVVLIVLGIFKMGTERAPNLLRGTVVRKYEARAELGVSTKGVNTEDSGYHLDVKVGEITYIITTLPVERWNTYQVGDVIDFIKPPSEQH